MQRIGAVAVRLAASGALLAAVACQADTAVAPPSVVPPSVLTPASATPVPTPEPVPRTPVHFETSDGVRIEGSLFGAGTVGVVLGHQSDGSQQEWWRFAQTLASNGYEALAIDFRSYCPGGSAGCSGDGTTADAWKDLLGAVGYLRSHGVHRVVLMGASMGGTASLVAAAKPGADIDSVISLSGSERCCGMVVDRAVIDAIPVPMLLLVGRLDGGSVGSTRHWTRWAGSDADTTILGTGEHGVDLLRLATPRIQERARQLILGFLAKIG